MKILLTGVTGFVGGEVLNQLLCDPTVAAVTVLTRRPLGGGAGGRHRAGDVRPRRPAAR